MATTLGVPAPRAATAAPAQAGVTAAVAPGKGTELYGYLPYWEMASGMADYLRTVPLTSLELFSAGVSRNGALDRKQTGYRRITGAIGARLISEAHARDQRVEIVFTSFGFDRNAALFTVPGSAATDPRWRGSIDDVTASGVTVAAGRAVVGLVGLVQRLGLDGVNVDVEQIAPAARDGFGAFVAALRQHLSAVDPGLRLSVATMANRSGANLASIAVAAGADRIFLMGYDFHWSGSDPGGSAPVERLDGGATLLTAMAEYEAAGVPADRILLGLPLYGMAWPVAAVDRYAERIGPGRAWLPSRHVAELTAPGFAPHPDPLEVSEFVSEAVPPAAGDPAAAATWQAVFYDSPRTLRVKLAIARAAGYAGGGFWALGYERGLPGYRELMADFLAGRVAPAPASDPAAVADPPRCQGRC